MLEENAHSDEEPEELTWALEADRDVTKILEDYLQPAEARKASITRRRSSIVGQDIGSIEKMVEAGDELDESELDCADLGAVRSDDASLLEMRLEAKYAGRAKADLEALSDKFKRASADLDDERREKMELATRSAELTREVAELTAFLKKAEKCLEETRHSVYHSRAGPTFGLREDAAGS